MESPPKEKSDKPDPLAIYPKPLAINISGSTTNIKGKGKKSKKKDKKQSKRESKKAKKESATKKQLPSKECPTESQCDTDNDDPASVMKKQQELNNAVSEMD